MRFLAGIDHGFSFPLAYFECYGLASWPEFLTDFVRHWPTDGDHVRVDDVREGVLPAPGKSVVAEVYPSIFRNRYPKEGRTADEQDAYAAARWMSDMDARAALAGYFEPPLTDSERATAGREGWILGVT